MIDGGQSAKLLGNALGFEDTLHLRTNLKLKDRAKWKVFVYDRQLSKSNIKKTGTGGTRGRTGL